VRTETESEIQRSICDYLALRKYCFWRTNNIPAPLASGGFRSLPKYTPRGLPDIIIVRDGWFIALEVKKKGGYQSKEQKEFEARIKDAGGEYWVVRSIDDVRELGL
jgi:hypothetical protein